METKTIISTYLTLSQRNWLNGLLMAVGTPVIVIIQQSIDQGMLVFNWKQLAMAAIGGAVTYLGRKLFEPSKQIKITKEVNN